jgi:hypothetical protein
MIYNCRYLLRILAIGKKSSKYIALDVQTESSREMKA